MDFLYLSEKQMLEAGVANMKKCNDTIDYMFRLFKEGDFREGGENNASHGLRLTFPKESCVPNMPLAAPGKWFTAMPAYLGGKYHAVGIKCYGADQSNPTKGIPRSVLMMSLMDADTGVPLAYMSANILSAARTGAVTGLFAKYMAPANPKRVAIVGPGIMSRYSLDSIMIEVPCISEIAVLGRGRKNLDKFKEHCDKMGYKFEKYEECTSMEDVCRDADIIVTANTQASTFEEYPYIAQKYLKKNALVAIVSALRVDKAMINDELNVVHVADDSRQYSKKRTIDAKPLDPNDSTITYKNGLYERISNNLEVLNMADIVSDTNFKRDENKIYVCASGGMPVEDVAWAYECYEAAKEMGIGTTLELWDHSELL